MEAKNPYRLSFCIPTYNRPKEFKRLFESLMLQVTPEVEVVIRDDSTDTTTEQCVKSHPLFPSQIQYYHGEKIGIDRANLFIASHATGEYVWWFGDDDVLFPGAIEKVLHCIKTNANLSFIFVNFRAEGSISPGVNIGESRLLRDGNEFLEKVNLNMTLLSTGVFRRTDALPAMPLGEKHVGTAFGSQPLLLEALSCGGGVYYIAEPLFLNYPSILVAGQNLFYDGVITFGIAYCNILNDFKKKIPYRTRRIFLGINFGHLWRGLVIGWLMRETPAPRKRLKELFPYYWSYPGFWVATLIFLLPKKVALLGYRLFKVFVKHSYRRPNG
jgi:glycosyltransferase involved in cell wall biosynthesis